MIDSKIILIEKFILNNLKLHGNATGSQLINKCIFANINEMDARLALLGLLRNGDIINVKSNPSSKYKLAND